MDDKSCRHRIVVIGAGYAGTYVAGTLARRLSAKDVEITVVNAEPDFVQRLQLHRIAAGHDVAAPSLDTLFAGTPVQVRIARVVALDPERQVVAVADADGGGELTYDTLLYALGSHVADHGVEGVAEHAYDVAARLSALRLRDRLDELERRPGGGTVVVVGDGFTGIETATELAESRPRLSVTLVGGGQLGRQLCDGARLHLRRACDRLGITVLEHTRVEAVHETGIRTADGVTIAADATVWTGGFAVHPIAAASGLAVTEAGRVVVDRSMQSVSHAGVYAAGDAVQVIGDNGRPLPMSCGSAGFTGRQAVEAILARLTDRDVPTTGLPFTLVHLSLGRRDAILQRYDAAARPKPSFTGGRWAARIKAAIVKGSLWSSSHPTFGMPKRRHRLVAGSGSRLPQVDLTA